MLVISLVLAGILFIVANLALRKSKRPLQTTLIVGIMLTLAPAFFLFVLTPIPPLQTTLLCVAMPFCYTTPRRHVRFLVLSTIATLGAFSPVAVETFERRREYAELRRQFPYESIEERLPHSPSPAEPLPIAAQEYLIAFENELEKNQAYRTRILKRLHEETTNLFVESPGFGYGRMVRGSRPNQFALVEELRNGQPIPQPGSSAPLERSVDRPPEMSSPIPEEINDLHLNSVLDFVHPKGFGYFKDRKHVAGFQAHGFSAVPAEKKIAVESVELVGLLHGEPRVYLSPSLPRMDELKTAPTRSLDAFEQDGLVRIHKGEDLITRPENGSIRMLGSIRSAKQCIACHGGERGDLLGAFSYVLRGK